MLLLFICIIQTIIIGSESYTFRCPSAAEWNLKASVTCANKNQYYCLLCPTTELYRCTRNPGGGYVEGCSGPVHDRKGFKKIIARSFTRESCDDNRYQPVIFNTNDTSDCVYEKSYCKDEGQVIFSNGSGKTDRVCSCDYNNGFVHVKLLQTQYCNPSGFDDCSCYLKSCDKFLSFSQDQKCAVQNGTNRSALNEQNISNKTDKDTNFLDDSSLLLLDIIGNRQKSKTTLTCLIFITLAFNTALTILIVYKKRDNVTKCCNKIDWFGGNKMHDTTILKVISESDNVTAMIIDEWHENDKKFVVTRASEHVLQCINNNSCVTVTGSVGVGKTATIRHVALQMKEEGYDILPIKYPWEVFKSYDSKRKIFYVIDDCCGKYNISQIDLENWKKEMNDVKRLLEKSSTKIIIGCRLQVYNDQKFSALSLFKFVECNLQSEKLRLSQKERQSIAELYLKVNSTKIFINNTFVNEFFPLLCSFSEGKSALKIQKLFQDPFLVYENELDKMNSEESYSKRCALALVVIFNNKLCEDCLIEDINVRIRSVIQNTCEACKLNTGTSRLVIRDELESLIDTFLTKHDNVYSTIHDKLFDFLAYYFGKHITSCLIKNADSHFIRERFTYSPQEDSETFTIVIPEKYQQIFIDRLLKDWAIGEVVNVFSNINMKFAQFRERFLLQIKTLHVWHQNILGNIVDKRTGETALFLNCKLGYEDFVHWCLGLNVDDNTKSLHGVSPLIAACSEGHTSIVGVLLKNRLHNHNADINECDNDCKLPLYMACQNGHTDKVDILFNRNADINKCDSYGTSPLCKACQNENIKIVEILLDNNADSKTCTYNGSSRLLWACQRCHKCRYQ